MSNPGELDSTASRQAVRHMRHHAVRSALTVVYPRSFQWSLELAREAVVLGRSASGHAPSLNHETVSRSHLRIDWDACQRRHFVIEQGSRNGTRLNGALLVAGVPAFLDDNAVLMVGDLLLVYERAASPKRSVASLACVPPGKASRTRKVRSLLSRAATDPSPILLLGETGTGKEWAAREAHRLSGRAGKLVAVNCAALSPQLIESQLFGHVKGAFTGAKSNREGFFRAAEKGTLFFDELGELPAQLQPKLLRALQERVVQPVGSAVGTSVDVRIIAATNRDLAQEVRDGHFRRDLYARIALWEISLPPLRERRVDILMWVETLHREWCRLRGIEPEPPQFVAEAASRVLQHRWEENLRGIDRLVHAVGVRSDGAPIETEELPSWILAPAISKPEGARPRTAQRRPSPTREEFKAVLEAQAGNVSAIAKHFDRDRRQIYRWLESFDLKPKRAGEEE